MSEIPGCGGRGGTIPNAALSPPEQFCIKMGSDENRFNVSINCEGQSHMTVSIDHNI